MTDVLARLAAALADRYTLERELGQGGMATVYLAHDVKHDRKVAIKVLRPELAAVLGAERFVQEIRTTANLQHPNILPLFDSGEADGFLYYVMPYVEGETLRAKLNRETQLGVEEAVKLTIEVADALDYAHHQNVIHRDIKPENILLHAGRPLVADFGIALAVSAAAGGRMTETGLSLGTPHYMSPEQATAEKQITARSDIYSLGAVLYEMLTGEPPHTGSSAQAIILKIVTDQARPVTDLRKAVPANVAAAVAQALEKLPADRFSNAAGFVAALGESTFRVLGENRTRERQPGTPWRLVVVVVAIATFIGGIGVGWSWLGSGREPARRTGSQYLSILLPDSAPLAFVPRGSVGVGQRALALTPDGRTLVYAAKGAEADQLYIRDLDAFVATPLPGTEGAYNPFVSPDGHWVGFFVSGELRKTPVRGGPVLPLVSAPEAFAATWLSDGRILLGLREGTQLAWVPESGGPLAEIPNPQGASGRSPRSLLPDGRHALVELWLAGLNATLGIVDLETGRTVALTEAGPVVADSVDLTAQITGMQPQFVPPRHLVYSTRAGLAAVEFDPVSHRLLGRPVVVLGGVRRDSWGAQFAVGDQGTLVYAPGELAEVGAMVWTAGGGTIQSLGYQPQQYGPFDLSPDGRRLAAVVASPTGAIELWIYDLDRGTDSRVMTNGIPSVPRWWDNRRIVFTETSPLPPYTRVSVRQLVESTRERDTLGIGWEINDIAPDSLRAAGLIGWGRGAWIMTLATGAPPIALDEFPGAWGPEFSRDGRWIAYTSNESGQYEVYVVDAERPAERQKISLAGGEEPIWSPRGEALFYRFGQRWFAVEVPKPGSARFGRPRVHFEGPFVNVVERSHDIAPDGRRHLVILGSQEQVIGYLNVITGWTAELTSRVGAGGPS